jgi:hypothetical protein
MGSRHRGAGCEARPPIADCLFSIAYCPSPIANLRRDSDGDSFMAKGQQRSNKEKRKPKKDKDDKKGAKK